MISNSLPLLFVTMVTAFDVMWRPGLQAPITVPTQNRAENGTARESPANLQMQADAAPALAAEAPKSVQMPGFCISIEQTSSLEMQMPGIEENARHWRSHHFTVVLTRFRNRNQRGRRTERV